MTVAGAKQNRKQDPAEKTCDAENTDLVIVGTVGFVGVEYTPEFPIELQELIHGERCRNGRVFVAVPRVLFEQWQASLRDGKPRS